MKKNTVIGLLGSTLDQGAGNKRWERWRPSVSICQHQDLLIEEYHLIYQKKFNNLLEQVVKDIKTASPETKIFTHEINFNDPWDFEEVYETLYKFADRFKFAPEKTNYLFHITTGTHVVQICFFLLTESRHFPGRLLQSSPDRSSCGIYKIIDLDLSKYDRIAARFQKELKDDISFLKYGIPTINKAFNQLIEKIEFVSIRTRDPILLTGPTGAGKSQLARQIYELRKQKKITSGAFVEINCATLRGDAAMSALFGHKKGAFTGAIKDRPGLLKEADQGIIFLDEIGELGEDEQAMLLHAIEEKSFMPLGADREEKSDFQLICGTNKDLLRQTRENSFREDLLARINLWTFKMPGLKERKEDIEPNITYELNKFEERYRTKITFNKEAKEAFLSFATSNKAEWKGNFRDLNAAITRMCTLAAGGRINEIICQEEIARLTEKWHPLHEGRETDLLEKYLPKGKLTAIDPFDKIQLEKVIDTCLTCKSLSEAGRKLFTVSRKGKNKTNDADRLSKYLAKFGLNWRDLYE